MVHLPAANGASRRTIHRSKWYGASRFGRKYLEGIICEAGNGRILSRRLQDSFFTDGVLARRIYTLFDSPVSETYFVPDHVPALVWTLDGAPGIAVEPYVDMRLYRVRNPEHGYISDMVDGCVVVSRCLDSESMSERAEGIDTGGTPEPVSETLWAACVVNGGALEATAAAARWRPMWYSLDAARRRYLRRLALRETEVVEHAPLWELATEWAYAPCRILAGEHVRLAIGFGTSQDEAVEAARTALDSSQSLEEEKRERLAKVLERSFFSCGHAPTDHAYSHVLSRLVDCLVVSAGDASTDSLSSGGTPAILAGDAYFQEAWKRDENISLGGLLATGQYAEARAVIDSTWQRQDESTGRLPLRLRTGEAPGYTSSDGTLWALLRLGEYVVLTGQADVLLSKLPLIAHFFRRSLSHCWQGLLPSGGIAVPGHEWETWMDTEFSARSGYPIEIQLLWLACLKMFVGPVRGIDAELSSQMEQAEQDLMGSLELFRSDEYFVDQLTFALDRVDLLTPNSYFWTVLDLYFDEEWENRSLVVARRELGGISGVRTLARSQWESVLGPQVATLARAGRPLPSVGKANYHRGVEWNWLSQLFVAGELRYGRPDMAFDHYLARQVHDTTNFAGLGGVSEVFDHRGPAGPDYQTWSMTGLLQSLQFFAGVTIDVPSGLIRVRPLKPRRWPHIRVRRWFGERPFRVEYFASRPRQELYIEFEAAVPEANLEIELPLRQGQRPRKVRITTSDGQVASEHPPIDVHESAAIIHLPARQWQRIELAV